MLQIIGKGGMALELAAYYDKTVKFAEYDEIQHLDPVQKTIIAVGSAQARKQIAETFKFNYCTLNFGKIYGDHTIDEGSIICPGAKITTRVIIGKHNIINVNSAIHHDAIIGDYVTISPGAIICGSVVIGDECFIGAGAVIKDHINICNNVVIGAGAVVVKDITIPGVYVGNPCKFLK